MKWTCVALAAMALILCGRAGAQDKPAAPAAAPAPAPAAAPAMELKSLDAKVSYALGMDIGAYLKELPIELDLTAFLRAIEDRVKGREALMTDQQAAEAKQEFMRKMQTKRDGERKTRGEANKKEGDLFLEQNAKKEGVATTASGLQYQVIKKGEGAPPQPTDRVKVHYRGTLLDGTVFDSSYDRDEPAEFVVNEVIPGWIEGLKLMPVGSKHKLFIPAKLAYGEEGAGEAIGPNAVLIFEVELLGIDKPQEPAQKEEPKEAPKK